MFIDEGNEFVFSDEFAEAIRATDNYYVIVAREGLPALPYSVEEIYGIRMSGKYGRLRQTYNEFYHIYGQMNINESIRPMRLITEDSNAGFQFFKSVCEKDGIKCLSAGGKTKLFQTAQSQGGLTLLIADGAAFGAEMAKIDALIQTRDDLMIYLPESFEWMILRSGILEDRSVSEMLDNPENYIESEKYFSWERFFTAVLIEKSAGGYLKYNKHRLNENYKNPQVTKKILQVMKKIEI
ncbi:MAG: translation initiation factor 2 [Bilifractor sp.]